MKLMISEKSQILFVDNFLCWGKTVKKKQSVELGLKTVCVLLKDMQKTVVFLILRGDKYEKSCTDFY